MNPYGLLAAAVIAMRSMQRLPNGNTLITEGAPGRVIEVTSDGQIVWEYHVTYFSQAARPTNSVYRAYRLPYEWARSSTIPHT
jgi:hypothetical protein